MKPRFLSAMFALATLATAGLGAVGCSADAVDAEETEDATEAGEDALIQLASSRTIDFGGIAIRLAASVNDTAAGPGNLKIALAMSMETASSRYPHPYFIDTTIEDGIHYGVFPYTQAAPRSEPDPIDATGVFARTIIKKARAGGGFSSLSSAGFSMAASEVPANGEVKLQLTTITDLVESGGARIHEGGPQCQVTIKMSVGADKKLVSGNRPTVTATCVWPGG